MVDRKENKNQPPTIHFGETFNFKGWKFGQALEFHLDGAGKGRIEGVPMSQITGEKNVPKVLKINSDGKAKIEPTRLDFFDVNISYDDLSQVDYDKVKCFVHIGVGDGFEIQGESEIPDMQTTNFVSFSDWTGSGLKNEFLQISDSTPAFDISVRFEKVSE